MYTDQPQGVGYIAAMLERNTSLRALDISRNALGFHCIHRLQVCTKRTSMDRSMPSNEMNGSNINRSIHSTR